MFPNSMGNQSCRALFITYLKFTRGGSVLSLHLTYLVNFKLILNDGKLALHLPSNLVQFDCQRALKQGKQGNL